MTDRSSTGDGPATGTPFTIRDPATIIQRGFAAKVSAADLKQAFDAIHALPPEHHTDAAARIVCLIELFGEPGQHEVTARVAAIDWRCLRSPGCIIARNSNTGRSMVASSLLDRSFWRQPRPSL